MRVNFGVWPTTNLLEGDVLLFNIRNWLVMKIWFPDFLNLNLTINLAIPTFSGTTPVTSVNNWIVVQQRIDSTTSFNVPWASYKAGFGTFNKNYWMGLEKIYQMTISRTSRLRIEMLNDLNKWVSVEYNSFYLDDETASYTIHVSGYSGDLRFDPMNNVVSFWVQNGMKFTTYDKENDLCSSCNCAYYCGGGGWYNSCHVISLTGTMGGQGFAYDDYDPISNTQNWHYLSVSRMMIKF